VIFEDDLFLMVFDLYDEFNKIELKLLWFVELGYHHSETWLLPQEYYHNEVEEGIGLYVLKYLSCSLEIPQNI